MPENAKILTNVSSFQDVQKSLQEVEKKLNELSKSVNSEAETEVSDKDGKTGDIKTTRNEDGTYTFEIKTKEGWKTPALGASLIKFKDKLSSLRQITTKSIDEIEADDSSTGDSTANLTTFDEKNNKFILPRPDYDSGFVTVIDQATSGTHNLGVQPSLHQILWTLDNGDTVTYHVMQPTNYGYSFTTSTTTWHVRGWYNAYYGFQYTNDTNSSVGFDSTATQSDLRLRVLLWK